MLVLKADRLIDGTGAAPITNGAVLVDGDRIVAAGPVDRVPAPESAEVVELPGGTLLPGLIDAHSHVALVPAWGDQPAQRRAAIEAQALIAAANLRRDLLSGVTTMRIVGEERYCDVAVRSAIQQGHIPGPHLLIAGRAFSATHGHGGAETTDGVDNVRKVARENFARGADLLKIFVTGGVSSPHTPLERYNYSFDEIQAAADEAHRAGKKLAAHAVGGPGVRLCLEAGVDTIEHGALVTDPDVDLLLQRNAWLVATFAIYYHPTGIEQTDGSNPAIAAKLARAREYMEQMWPAIVRSGVKLTLGTDAMHGLLPFEVETLARLGAPPLKAIEAATRNAAECLGIADRTGTLEPGKVADVIGVGGDPERDVTALRDVRLVLKAGVRYDGISLL